MERATGIGVVAWTVALALAIAPANPARAQGPEWDTVVQATDNISDIPIRNHKGLPPSILRSAYAVAIFPEIRSVSIVIGGRHGNGVLLVRRADGWSNPLFVSYRGGSVGAQAGFQRTDLVLVFKNRKSLNGFLAGQSKMTLGLSGGAAVGGVGADGELRTDTALQSEVVAFSKSTGLFLGASIAGGRLEIDWQANANFYGRMLTANEILTRPDLPVPEPAVTLRIVLTQKTGISPQPRAPRPGTVVVQTPPPAGSVIVTPAPTTPAPPANYEADYPFPRHESEVGPPATTSPFPPDDGAGPDLQALPPPSEAAPTDPFPDGGNPEDQPAASNGGPADSTSTRIKTAKRTEPVTTPDEPGAPRVLPNRGTTLDDLD